MNKLSIFIILFFFGIKVYSQDIDEKNQVKQLEAKIELHKQVILSFEKSIDSLNLIISQKLYESIKDSGFICSLRMDGGAKSTPEVLGEIIFNIPKNSKIQVISYVENSDDYYRIIYDGQFGFMNGVFLNDSCNTIVLKNNPVKYDREKDFLGNELDKMSLKSNEELKENQANSTYKKNSHSINTGPRGGKYYINSKGNKTYIKH